MKPEKAAKYVQSLLDGEVVPSESLEKSMLGNLRKAIQEIEQIGVTIQKAEDQRHQLYNAQQRLIGQREAYLQLLTSAEDARVQEAKPAISLDELTDKLGVDKVELITNAPTEELKK